MRARRWRLAALPLVFGALLGGVAAQAPQWVTPARVEYEAGVSYANQDPGALTLNVLCLLDDLRIDINWGDGTQETFTGANSTPALRAPLPRGAYNMWSTHQYSTPGTYAVTGSIHTHCRSTATGGGSFPVAFSTRVWPSAPVSRILAYPPGVPNTPITRGQAGRFSVSLGGSAPPSGTRVSLSASRDGVFSSLPQTITVDQSGTATFELPTLSGAAPGAVRVDAISGAGPAQSVLIDIN